MAKLVVAAVFIALALEAPLSVANPTESSHTDCIGLGSTCHGTADLVAAVEGNSDDADFALHLLQRKTAAVSGSADDAGPAPGLSKCAAYAKCHGCSGEACSYCHQEADLECCLDMHCHGCSGESCSHCQNQNLAKCCAGAPMHVRKCSQSANVAGPTSDPSKCAAYAKCHGCSGEACSYCHQEADLECCLDM
eukprot:CAMPEP_0115634456 /NCGR_PEP_ID=MMETSP0272-20121206/32594_1 /TAXON_ID=71861 /ORGANISM="Scrippsiella trochoidea, Strain CCMP3099" /LENGTH=192 /DNA_ID=CAMNT_0003071293 /DNA_START=33 /DNA_END=608 /DNA_ORIENTATION=+